jgi:hypothetical protein
MLLSTSWHCLMQAAAAAAKGRHDAKQSLPPSIGVRANVRYAW